MVNTILIHSQFLAKKSHWTLKHQDLVHRKLSLHLRHCSYKTRRHRETAKSQNPSEPKPIQKKQIASHSAKSISSLNHGTY